MFSVVKNFFSYNDIQNKGVVYDFMKYSYFKSCLWNSKQSFIGEIFVQLQYLSVCLIALHGVHFPWINFKILMSWFILSTVFFSWWSIFLRDWNSFFNSKNFLSNTWTTVLFADTAFAESATLICCKQTIMAIAPFNARVKCTAGGSSLTSSIDS